ncbi:helix-turn-helix transcriptional regulator [Pontibacter rugosus]|uniref:Helix-turn-helix transcriptional regulator n=1 Tax=Pontibacter rugosus TaxID=1745966 RepID=A0ABW3SML5_9BACT
MIDRIKQLMEYKSLSSTQFADAIEIPRATVSHILSERNKPSLEVIMKIASTYRDVSINWLMLGEGAMTAANAATPAVAAPEITSDHTVDSQPATVKTANIATAANKQVQQIVIFYSDNSFTAYTPG